MSTRKEHIDVKVDTQTATRLDHARADEALGLGPAAEYSEIIAVLLARHCEPDE